MSKFGSISDNDDWLGPGFEASMAQHRQREAERQAKCDHSYREVDPSAEMMLKDGEVPHRCSKCLRLVAVKKEQK